MSNYRRAYFPGGVYFCTVVTFNRIPVFTDEVRVEVLRQAFRKVMTARPFEIGAMVVMPEHLHCIWRMPEGDADYSSRWREIKKATSRQISMTTNARSERMVWQRRLWEHTIRDEEDWRRHMDYIHYNPVRHGLASHGPGLRSAMQLARAGMRNHGVPASRQPLREWITNDEVCILIGGCAALIHPTQKLGCK